MKFLVAFLLWVAVMLSRPMALGYAYATLGLSIATFAGILAITFSRSLKIPSPNFKIFACSMILGLSYSCVLMMSDLSRGLKFGTMVVAFNIALALATSMSRHNFRLHSKVILRVIVISGCITSGFFLIFSLDPLGSDLAYFSFPIKDRTIDEVGSLRWPISTIMYRFSTGSWVFPRSSFLAIEPGIAPALIVLWRLSEANNGRITSLLLDAIFLLAMTLTFSTTVPAVCTVFFILRAIFIKSRKVSLFGWVVIFCLLISGVGFIFYAPGIGFFAKIESHTASFTDRLSWYTDSSSSYIRISSIIFMVLNIALCFSAMSKEKFVMAPILILISAMNVLAFTPLYFISLFVFALPKKATKINQTKCVAAIPMMRAQ